MSEEKQNNRPPDNPPAPGLNEQILEVKQTELAEVQPLEPLAVAQEKLLELDRLKIENEHLRNALGEAKDLRKLRRIYTTLLFALIVGWLSVVVLFVYWSAVDRNAFNLTDGVLIAFITSTTVTVIGLFVIVAKWLFPSSHNPPETKKS